MSKGVYMAGGWWYCDCNKEVLQELTHKKAPSKEGEENPCPACGMLWVAKTEAAGVLTVGGEATLWWWRPDRGVLN